MLIRVPYFLKKGLIVNTYTGFQDHNPVRFGSSLNVAIRAYCHGYLRNMFGESKKVLPLNQFS